MKIKSILVDEFGVEPKRIKIGEGIYGRERDGTEFGAEIKIKK